MGQRATEPEGGRTFRPRRYRGLRFKLVVATVILVCAPVAVVSLIGVYEAVYRRSVSAEVAAAGEALGDELVAAGVRVEADRGSEGPRLVGPAGGAPSPEELVARFARGRHVMVRILDGRGRVLRATSARDADRWSDLRGLMRGASALFFGDPGPPELLAFEATLPADGDREEVLAALAGRPAEAWRYDEGSRTLILYRALPMPEGEGVLYLTRASRRGIRSLYDLRFQLFRLTLVLALVAGAMGLWIGRRWVTPLVTIERRIAEYLKRPRGGPPRVGLERRDEIGALSRQLEGLVTRLHRRVDETAAVAHDLAHDIKSPIATVEAAAEMLEGRAALDGERRARLAVALSTAAGRMRGSVEGLLELARLDERLEREERRVEDLAELAREAAERWRGEARGRDLEVEVAVEVDAEEVRVLASRPELDRLLDCLLENAVDFCRGRVLVRLSAEGGEARLLVCDDGPGVAPGDRARVFGRFFSARPEGRRRGTGLGLAIVEAVAHAHGGSAELLEHGPLPGAAFAVRLPLA